MVLIIIGLFSTAYAETSTPVAPASVKFPVPPAVTQSYPKTGELLDWWKGGNQAIPKGQEITIIDVKTGKSFKAVRTYGHNHADMETLSNADTLKMVEIWGGSWNWERRPVVVISNGRAIAGSSAGMPHAGLDKAPAESTVSGRSGGFGRGTNLDKIKNNGLDGVFDLHLLNSRNHNTNRVNALHQAAIQVASGK